MSTANLCVVWTEELRRRVFPAAERLPDGRFLFRRKPRQLETPEMQPDGSLRYQKDRDITIELEVVPFATVPSSTRVLVPVSGDSRRAVVKVIEQIGGGTRATPPDDAELWAHVQSIP